MTEGDYRHLEGLMALLREGCELSKDEKIDTYLLLKRYWTTTWPLIRDGKSRNDKKK